MRGRGRPFRAGHDEHRLRCESDPSHYAHPGICASVYADEVAHLAWMNGVPPIDTKTGWPPSHRRHAAARLGVSKRTLDRALLRHHYYRQRQQEAA